MAHSRGGPVAHEFETSDDLRGAGRRVSGSPEPMSTNATAGEKDSASDAPYLKNTNNATVHKALGDATHGIPVCRANQFVNGEPAWHAPEAHRCGRCWGDES